MKGWVGLGTTMVSKQSAQDHYVTNHSSEGEPCARGDLLHPAFSWMTWLSPPGAKLSEPCRDVTKRCRAWWTEAAWSIRLTWPNRECLRLIVSFIDGSCEGLATSTFVTNSYQRTLSVRLWFVVWKASSFAISASNCVHVSEAYSKDDKIHEL